MLDLYLICWGGGGGSNMYSTLVCLICGSFVPDLLGAAGGRIKYCLYYGTLCVLHKKNATAKESKR